MIQVWKYLHHQQDVDPALLFTLKKDVALRTTRLSGDELALADINCDASLDVRRQSFTVRVVRPWNSLPLKVRQCSKIDSF